MLPMKLNLMGGVDISLPNVSYCEDARDVHYNPYNTVEFYVGEITGTTPQTVKIHTDRYTTLDKVTVSEGNKWYTYVLPKDKGLYQIEGDSVKKVNVKADISSANRTTIIPSSTVEASFKGSNTSKVTDMSNMFYECSGLKSLDVSNFNTTNVTDMDYMFYYCAKLTSLDVSNFDTSNVTSMEEMFSDCYSLTSLDLSKWDTSNVYDMDRMFDGCDSLTSLDLSKWDTSNVSNIYSIFGSCSSLTSLNLSGWNTSKITSTVSMFINCSNLAELDLSGWDTSNVTNDNVMFEGCTSLKTIRMVGCSEATVNKIKAQLTKDNITGVTITT